MSGRPSDPSVHPSGAEAGVLALRRLADFNLIGIAYWNLDGRLTWANDAFLAIVGRAREDLVSGRVGWRDITPPEFAAIDDRALADLKEHGFAGPFEKEYQRPDGSRVRVLMGGAHLPDDQRSGVTFVVDLSRQRSTEHDLEQANSLLRATLESTADGILVVDGEGRIVSSNARFAKMWRIPEMVLATRDDNAALAWVLDQVKEPDAFLAKVRELYANPLASSYDVLSFKDGRVFERYSLPQVVDGRSRGRVWSFRDVTEHRLAEAALRESERRARVLVDNSSEGIMTFDARGIVLWASAPALRLLGYRLDEVRGLDVVEFIHHEDITTVMEALRQVLDDATRRVTLRARVRHADGHWRTVEGVYTNMLEEPAMHAVVAHFRDVTDSLVLQEQLVQAQKMEAIGRLAGGVAHDFNNLLTAIVGHAELLRDALPAESEEARDLEEIEKAASRAGALTQRLLAFSRRQVLQPKVFDPGATLEGMRRMLERLIGEDVRLAVELSPDAGHVRTDPAQFEQALLNLVLNARDAMPRGGEIRLTTAPRDLDEWYAKRHDGVTAGPHVAIAVTDTGIGMDEVTRSRIFEPFFTTKKQGTGLGLSTVYGVVRQSGGDIEVESVLGKGTSFTILLPAVPAAAVVPAPEKTSAAGGSETVLVVEDEPVVRELTAKILRKRGYTVLEAEGGAQALSLAAEHQGIIHLLLTDVVMPEMGGPEVAQRLRAARPGTLVLYMSGYTDEAILKHGALDASTPFLQKPFTPWGLAARVRDLLDRR
jgi:PAS domain S-box-containing protein